MERPRRWWPAAVLLLVVTLPLIIWSTWQQKLMFLALFPIIFVFVVWPTWRRAARVGRKTDALWYSSSSLNARELKRTYPAYFDQTRFHGLSGGWYSGPLTATAAGIHWHPGPVARRLHNVTPISLPWGEIRSVHVRPRSVSTVFPLLDVEMVTGDKLTFGVGRLEQLSRAFAGRVSMTWGTD